MDEIRLHSDQAEANLGTMNKFPVGSFVRKYNLIAIVYDYASSDGGFIDFLGVTNVTSYEKDSKYDVGVRFGNREWRISQVIPVSQEDVGQMDPAVARSLNLNKSI